MKRISRRPGSRESQVYEARTQSIVVRVAASFEPEQSDPEAGEFFWVYTVEIENHGKETVQLVSRRWVITDAQNRVQVVSGPGVVGEQPELKAGEAFRYSSGCPLKTPSGTMQGTYQMVTHGGQTFDAEIPEFSLHLPGAGRVVN